MLKSKLNMDKPKKLILDWLRRLFYSEDYTAMGIRDGKIISSKIREEIRQLGPKPKYTPSKEILEVISKP